MVELWVFNRSRRSCSQTYHVSHVDEYFREIHKLMDMKAAKARSIFFFVRMKSNHLFQIILTIALKTL